MTSNIPRYALWIVLGYALWINYQTWLKDYAAKVGAVYADYYTALVDDGGMLKDGLSGDGLHPNAKGYELMAPVAETAIEKALR